MAATPGPVDAAQAIGYPDLPITARRDELIEAITHHQVLVVAGATGSGKSTQLPKLCLEAGRGSLDERNGRHRWIGHTQPRRIAARAIGARLADELGPAWEGRVGVKVRFTGEVAPPTRVKVMTDGILLSEIRRDRELRRYDTLIVDEAHERSLNVDFLLGYLKGLLPRRPDLHVIVTSATIDTARFAAHFDDAPVIEVEGRSHPVEIRYRPLDPGGTPTDHADDVAPRDQNTAICDAVRELHREHRGDMLVFCSGEREIRDAAAAIGDLGLADTEVFPLFARLSNAEQQRVFQAHRGRRIVIATNVAETSITVPGIDAVIDVGTARVSRYSARTKVQRLPVEPVSQASANQRAGRCGRTGPGVCIRLYSLDDFDARPEFTQPEVQRTNLAAVVLQMATLRLGEVRGFPFIDPPPDRNVRDGIALLEELGAVDPSLPSTARGWVTPIGRRLARLPIDPRLGRMLLAAAAEGTGGGLGHRRGTLHPRPRESPADRRDAARQAHAVHAHPSSDFLSLLNLWRHLEVRRAEHSGNRFRRMCRDEFLNPVRVREWQDLHGQLLSAMRDLGERPNTVAASEDSIHRALLAGLLSHIGERDDRERAGVPGSPSGRGARGDADRHRRGVREYRGARQATFAIGRDSVTSKAPPPWVMAAELVETNRMWAHTVAPVQVRWIERVGAHLVRRSHSEPEWDRARGAAHTLERITLYGVVLEPRRRVGLARIDPTGAREMFVHHALVLDDWDTHHRFVEHNREVRAEAERLVARTRRGDLLVERDRLYDWFDERIPPHVTSAAAFDKWWQQARTEHPDLLCLSVRDLVDADVEADLDTTGFPETWETAGLRLGVDYEYDPVDERDGVVITVPVAAIARLSQDEFDWLVPGLRVELVEALLRTMPKPLRRLFVPIPEVAAEVAATLDPTSGTGPVVGVRAALNAMLSDPLPPDALAIERLPARLRPTFRVVDAAGSELGSGPDLAGLAARFADVSRSDSAALGADLMREGLTTWPSPPLPAVVSDSTGVGRAYPALADRDGRVDVVMCATVGEQATTNWDGIRRLLRLGAHAPARAVDAALTDRDRRLMDTTGVQRKVDWYHDVVHCALDAVMTAHGPLPTDAEDFDRLRAEVADRLGGLIAEIGRHAVRHLEAIAAIRTRLASMYSERLDTTVRDATEHLDRLVFEGYLTAVGHERLADLTRYLTALEHRLATAGNDIARDGRRTHTCRSVEAAYDRLCETVPWSPEVEALAWSLEELRVATFAQHLGTATPVSAVRIERRIRRLAGAS
ncbi:MAG: ATP-dependent RNA helicase HrpA [Microthrixaceae bacterium]